MLDGGAHCEARVRSGEAVVLLSEPPIAMEEDGEYDGDDQHCGGDGKESPGCVDAGDALDVHAVDAGDDGPGDADGAPGGHAADEAVELGGDPGLEQVEHFL